MARDEVARLVADISQAIQSSDLLSLLRQDLDHQHPPQHQYLHETVTKRSLRNPPILKCLSEIPKSILDVRVEPIRTALEKIDARRLLDLEIIQEIPTQKQNHHHGQHHTSQERGARLRDGVYCRPICGQIRPKLDLDDDASMYNVGDDDDDDSINHDNNGNSNVKGNRNGNGNQKPKKSSVVRYLHIAEVPDEYTIGIFVFGPHESIPLHDHPEMCVLSRVLYGDLKRLSLDLDRLKRTPDDKTMNFSNRDTHNNDDVDEDEDDDKDDDDTYEDLNDDDESLNEASASSMGFAPEKQKPEAMNHASASSFSSATSWISRSANWLTHNLYNSSSSVCMVDDESSRHLCEVSTPAPTSPGSNHHPARRQEERFPEGTKLAYKNSIDTLRAPDVASLYPYEGNLHEFVAGPYGAAVLDVLLPPYDDERKRDCTFYNIREISLQPTMATAASTATTTATTTTTTAMPVTTTATSNSTAATSSRWNNWSQHSAQDALHHSVAAPSSSSPKTTQKGDTHPREPCLIIPTGQPENFHCISGRYKDLGETDDYYDYQYDDD